MKEDAADDAVMYLLSLGYSGSVTQGCHTRVGKADNYDYYD